MTQRRPKSPEVEFWACHRLRVENQTCSRADFYMCFFYHRYIYIALFRPGAHACQCYVDDDDDDDEDEAAAAAAADADADAAAADADAADADADAADDDD